MLLFFFSISRDFLKAGDKENIFNADHFPLWYRRAAEQIPGSFVYSIPFSTGECPCWRLALSLWPSGLGIACREWRCGLDAKGNQIQLNIGQALNQWPIPLSVAAPNKMKLLLNQTMHRAYQEAELLFCTTWHLNTNFSIDFKKYYLGPT